jgi:acetyl esterase
MTAELDQDAAALLEVMRAVGTPQPYQLSVEQAREQLRAALVTRGEPVALRRVEDLALPSPHGALRTRLYQACEGKAPIALFLHGGGWVQGDLDTHDRLCRKLARRSGCLIVALDYRRAPEHPHPAALQDALLAYRWLLDNAAGIGGDASIGGSASPVAVMGESSGGATVACLSLLLRDLGAPLPRMQLLVYPVTDARDHWPSRAQHGSGYTLDLDFVRWSLAHYLPPGHDPHDRYALPLCAEDLSGLPATVLVTAEFDPLRDEGIEYARKLKAAGVDVEHIHAADQMHGFMLVDRAVAKAAALIDRLADALVGR